MSHIENEIKQYCTKLEKLCSSEAGPTEIIDVLTLLKKIHMTIDILRSTGAGKVIQDVKKKSLGPRHTDG